MRHLRIDRLMLYVFLILFINSWFGSDDFRREMLAVVLVVQTGVVCIIDEISKLKSSLDVHPKCKNCDCELPDPHDPSGYCSSQCLEEDAP